MSKQDKEKSTLSVITGVGAGILAGDAIHDAMGADDAGDALTGIVGGGIVGKATSEVVDVVEDILGLDEWL